MMNKNKLFMITTMMLLLTSMVCAGVTNITQPISFPNDFGVSENTKIMISIGDNNTQEGGGDGIYVSRDYGNTWNHSVTTGYYTNLAISSDGQKMLVTKYDFSLNEGAGGQLNTSVSVNNGTSWTVTNILAENVGISRDGLMMYASVSTGGFYWSNNNGSTWNLYNDTGLYNARIIGIDEDGTTIVTVGFDSDTANNSVIMTSNAGLNWTNKTIEGDLTIAGGYPGGLIRDVRISNNGSNIIMFGELAYYTSTNYGVSWTTYNQTYGYVVHGDASNDFTRMVKAPVGENTNISLNSGTTWNNPKIDDTNPYTYVFRVLDDGSKLYQVSGKNEGYIYIYDFNCTENWVLSYTPVVCTGNVDGATKIYTDTNRCATINTLPESNGTTTCATTTPNMINTSGAINSLITITVIIFIIALLIFVFIYFKRKF